MQSLPTAPLILRAGNSAAQVVARVRPWAFEANVAHLVLYNQSRLPAPADIISWISQLRLAGYDTVRTGALGVQAGARFERLGFEAIQSLVLLEHTSIGSVSLSGASVARLAEHDDLGASNVDGVSISEYPHVDRQRHHHWRAVGR